MVAKPGKTKTETYEDEVKKRFIEEPANMRLLIVVDKLLTGLKSISAHRAPMTSPVRPERAGLLAPLLQRRQLRVHLRQYLGDGALFGKGWEWNGCSFRC